MGYSTISGSSPGSMPKVIGTVMPTFRSFVYRAGTTLCAHAIENYDGLNRRRRAPNRLILGPWTHGDRSLNYAGDANFGSAAAIDANLAEDFFVLRRNWFDRWLKGVENGVDKEPAVRIVVMGGGSGRRNTAGRLDHGGKMARRSRLAATVDPMDRLLPAWRPDARPGETGRGAAAARLPLRPARSRAAARRRAEFG